MTKLLVAFVFLALNFYTYNFLASQAVIPPRATFDAFPLDLGEWSCSRRERMEPEIESNLGVTDYLICTYSRIDSSQFANVYVGYHATQIREEGGGAGENSIHPPAHCLPGSGWDIIHDETVEIDMAGLPDRPAQVRRLLVAKGDYRQLVYYWYQSRGRVVSQDWKKIVYVGLDRALRGRTDGALVRFTVPIVRGNVDDADATFQSLAPRVLARLPDYVPG